MKNRVLLSVGIVCALGAGAWLGRAPGIGAFSNELRGAPSENVNGEPSTDYATIYGALSLAEISVVKDSVRSQIALLHQSYADQWRGGDSTREIVTSPGEWSLILSTQGETKSWLT